MTDDIFDLERLRRNFMAADRAPKAAPEAKARKVRPRSLRADALALLDPLERDLRARLGEDRRPALLLLAQVRAALVTEAPDDPLDPAALAGASAAVETLGDYLEAKLLIRKR